MDQSFEERPIRFEQGHVEAALLAQVVVTAQPHGICGKRMPREFNRLFLGKRPALQVKAEPRRAAQRLEITRLDRTKIALGRDMQQDWLDYFGRKVRSQERKACLFVLGVFAARFGGGAGLVEELADVV